MSWLHRVAGLAWAALTGAGLWLLWPEVVQQLRGTWLHDLRIPAIIIYTLTGIWIAERCWTIIRRRFGERLS